MSDALRTVLSVGRSALGRIGLVGLRSRSRQDEVSVGGLRGRLFSKYVLLLVGLVGVVLLINAGLQSWFSYEENKASLFRIQQEKARSAAHRIEGFVDDIEHQLGWTAAPQWAASPLEQRRFDLVRLLHQAPAITELIQLDDHGKEQLEVSRLAMDVTGSGKDYSQSPDFIEAQKHRIWFSPVYFRKESEPYMTVAMAEAGRNAGVIIAEVNLKLIWDVIAGLKLGEHGYAYVIDRDGRLIAHPDISLVLRNTDLANLPQVAAARAEAQADQFAPPVIVAKNINGEAVLTAHAAVVPLGWTVFVENPLSDALAPLYGAAWRMAALFALALVLATLAALLLARRMVVPIRLLQAGAARIGAGELDRRIDIHTGDELEELAGEFNRMAGDLQKSYAQLEQKVEDRTAELKEALEQQTATAEVLGVINSSPGDLAPVFDAILEQAHALCGAAKGSMVTYDGERYRTVATRGLSAAYAKLLREVRRGLGASNSPSERLLRGESLVQISNLATENDPIALAAAELEGARTVLFVPLRKDGALLGYMTAYRQEVRPFSDKQIALLQNFAAQAVIAMENARLITETREALEQQTATAEVLQVINSSPGDLGPVFGSMLEKAMRLCEAAFGTLWTFDGACVHAAALHNVPPVFAEFLTRAPHQVGPDSAHGRLLRGEPVVHIPDIVAEKAYRLGDPIRRALVELGGGRTLLAVPLRKDNTFLGDFVIYRQEARPFSDKQIALLQNFAAQAVIAMENARLITETREALEQQTATAEVLQVINSSPGDLAPVFETILDKAHTLCGATLGSLFLFDGELFRAAATHGYPEDLAQRLRQGVVLSATTQLLDDSVRWVHNPDLTLVDTPTARAVSRRGGVRTNLMLPLRKDGRLLGAISCNRQEIRPFADKEIALLQNFAAQAVIAMENARLITETREALEQQTATAEVLQVINSSPGDLAPVFNVILEKAHTLCGAAHGSLQLYDGENLHAVATHGVSDKFAEILRQGYRAAESPASRALIEGERFAHIADCAEIDHPVFRSAAELAGIHTVLFVPLRRDNEFLGLISAARLQVRPFSDKQIALLQNFAAQAVIAMENARLINETREALDQQTATAEVLGVINSSPGDLAPVFDAMLERSMRLCEAAFGDLSTYDGERFCAVATRGFPPALIDFYRDPFTPGPESYIGRLVSGEIVLHVADMAARYSSGPVTPLSRAGVEPGRALVELGNARTGLFLALRKDDALLGAMRIYRQEMRPFTEKEIALLQNFAAQAVIAMENARLITETREALEQQTATAEVLGVINSSPGDLAPVFDAMLEKALALCGAAFGALFTYDGECFPCAATRGFPPALLEYYREPIRPVAGSAMEQLVRGESASQVTDIRTDAFRSPLRRALADLGGARTMIWVALRKEKSVLGCIAIYRQEARPFSEKEIALLQNFAAQAVIAMENARLITETREALEQQTATAEVLGVINSSPGDLAPVFDAMLEKATRLCQTAFGAMFTYDGEAFHVTAVHGPAPFVEHLKEHSTAQADAGTMLAQHINGELVVERADVASDQPRNTGPAIRRAFVELGGARSGLSVALRKDERLLGVIQVYRQDVRPFSDKQIALLQNFAAQAVIAMENARLLTETREALEQQTATAEVLQVINSSPGDLAPVFDAILEKATHLCDVPYGSLELYDGERFRAVAVHGLSKAFADKLQQGYPASDNPATRPLIEGSLYAHITDLAETDYSITQSAVELVGARTLLCVPLRRDNALLGMIACARQELRPFSEKEIALLQNFAAQAVIAMENARLITETREALEQQTATAEVLQVINSSPGDLAPVFDAILQKAHSLCDVAYGSLELYDGEYFRAVATIGFSDAFADMVRKGYRAVDSPDTWALVEGERYAHILDLAETDAFMTRTAADLDRHRTLLCVPLRRDAQLLGLISSARKEVRPFTDKEIALLENFAAQAVIAMENVRLITELRQRTHDLQESLEYQTASGDVLKVISRSGAELGPVLDTLVETAARICRADSGFIFRAHDGLCRMVASFGIPAEYKDFQTRNPIAPGRGTLAGRTVLERRAVHIEDAAADPEYTRVQAVQLGRQRTMLGVPLIREDTLIGVITLARAYVEPFSEKQIGLVTTFADQAVIAIENARLFNELRERTTELGRSVEELKMLGEVGRAVSSTLDLRSVLSTVLTASLGVTWANAGAIFRYIRAERAFRLVEAVGWDEALARSVRDLRVVETETAMGEAVTRQMPIQLADLAERPSAPLRDAALAGGFHSALIVPLVGAERILGAITLMRQEAGEFPAETVRLMQTLASQSVLAIQNARLFREIADKSEQLALASQHKSQFLANMSHELRTPLNAILGYAELLVDGIYGALPERPKGVIERIQNNGKHLLALINDVLDLAKIEAGQLTLTLEDYSLPEVVTSVVTATEPLATSKGLKFTTAVQDGMPMAHGDARRVSQVLLNLVGNAIKFTDEGEIEIRAAAERGQFVLTVRDTGPGIPDADQERIFGEFQQIDNSNTRKQGGTGLGLAISKRMVEMQGGMISVDSVVGKGSTFRVLLPIHVDEVLEEAA